MMRNRPLFYLVVLFYLTYLDICLGGSPTYYLDQYPTNVNLPYKSYQSSIILVASISNYPVNGRYSFTVNVPTGIFETYRIHGTVKHFRIRNGDHFRITNTNGYMNNTIYDNKNPYSSFLKSFNTGTTYNKALIFELQLNSYEKFEGFDITLTAARRCFASFDSLYDEFYCSNNYCIKDNLRCNGRDNCGNNKDETTAWCSKASIIGFSVGGVLLFVALIAGCVILCRRRRATTLGSGTAVIIPSQGNIYPGSQVPVPYPVPPGTYLYNTNQPNWQQFPNQNGIPPPPYQNEQRY